MELENVKIEFTDDQMNKLVKKLQGLFKNQQSDFANLCYTVYQISHWFVENQDCVLRMKKTSTYYNEKELFNALGIKNRTKQRYIQCFEKYVTLNEESVDIDAKIAEPFVSFAPSKLIELLPISNNVLLECISKKQITPEMTVKQLRDFFADQERKELLVELEESEDEYVAGDFEDNFIILKNDTARKDFVDSYRSWGLWFEEKRLGLKYYRCKIGDKILVAVLSQFQLPTGENMDDVKYYYMNTVGCLDLNSVSVTQLLNDFKAVEDNKVYMFEE